MHNSFQTYLRNLCSAVVYHDTNDHSWRVLEVHHGKIEHILMNDELIFELLDELQTDSSAAIGFRHLAQQTQGRQDRHLEIYKLFIRSVKQMPLTASHDNILVVAFPADFSILYKFIRFFMMYVFRQATPRARISGLKTSNIEH